MCTVAQLQRSSCWNLRGARPSNGHANPATWLCSVNGSIDGQRFRWSTEPTRKRLPAMMFTMTTATPVSKDMTVISEHTDATLKQGSRAVPFSVHTEAFPPSVNSSTLSGLPNIILIHVDPCIHARYPPLCMKPPSASESDLPGSTRNVGSAPQ